MWRGLKCAGVKRPVEESYEACFSSALKTVPFIECGILASEFLGAFEMVGWVLRGQKRWMVSSVGWRKLGGGMLERKEARSRLQAAELQQRPTAPESLPLASGRSRTTSRQALRR